jgi:hypothetical protein
MLVQEKDYKVSVSRGKEVLVSIKSRDNLPTDRCSIIYDGRDHALFYRHKNETILLDYVTQGFKEIVPVEKQVYIAELVDNQIEKIYIVPVKMVPYLPEAKKMPRPEEEIMQEIEDAQKDGTIQETGDKLLKEFDDIKDEE